MAPIHPTQPRVSCISLSLFPFFLPFIHNPPFFPAIECFQINCPSTNIVLHAYKPPRVANRPPTEKAHTMFSDENLPSSSRSRETDTFSLASTVDQSETSTIRRRTSDETLLSQATTLVPSSASTLRRRRSEDTLLDSFRGGASNIRHRASEETLLSVPESVPLLDQPQLCNNLIKNLYDDTIKLLGMMARIVSNQCFHGYDHLSSRFKWTAQLLENWEFLVCRQYRPGQIDLSDMEAMLLKAGHKEVYRNVFTALAEYLFLFCKPSAPCQLRHKDTR